MNNPSSSLTQPAAQQPNIIWQPQPGSQTAFLQCPFFEAIYGGTRGPGKTDALLMSYAQYVGRGYCRHWRGIIFREEATQLEDLVAKSKKWFYRIFPTARWLGSGDTRKWVFEDGEELLFRHMKNPDDYWKYHGNEYPFVGWEELTNWSTLACYQRMKSCCRSSHKGIPHLYRATCNPYGRGHNAVKKYIIDPAPAGTPIETTLKDDDGNETTVHRVYVHGVLAENKILLQNDPNYRAVLTASAGGDKNLEKAWIQGSWDITAGGMFDDLWDKNIHVLEPFKIPSSWRVDRAFDWGASAPYSLGYWAESDGTEVQLANGVTRSFPPKTLFLIHEIYGSNGEDNKGLNEPDYSVGRKIAECDSQLGYQVQPGPADNQIFDTNNNGQCIADEYAKSGVRFERSNKSPGSRVTRWKLIRDRLTASTKHPMESPGLFVFSTCRKFIELFPTVPRSKNNPDDVDTDCEDHIADMTGYRVLHRPVVTTLAKVSGF